MSEAGCSTLDNLCEAFDNILYVCFSKFKLNAGGTAFLFCIERNLLDFKINWSRYFNESY